MPSLAMLEDLRLNWHWVALRGAVATLFGVCALIWPGITLAMLVLLWGAFALADGVVALVTAFRVHDAGRPFWSLAIEGVLGVGAGILTFMWPGITAFALLVVIATWAILMGIFQIIAAVRLRKEIENEWLLGLSGGLSVVFGMLLLTQPAAGALALVWTIGGYAIFFGILLIVLGFRLRGHIQHRLARA